MERQVAGLDQRQRERKGEFEPAQAHRRRVVAGATLFRFGVRRVIGAEAIERAVLDPCEQRHRVSYRTQRRVHFRVRVGGLARRSIRLRP